MSFKEKWAGVPKGLRITVYTILGILGLAAMAVVFGFGIMLLWNWLMPQIFHLGVINYWQAVGVFILARILFGGIGGSGSSGSKRKGKRSAAKECQGDSRKAGDEPAGMEYYDEWWQAEGKKAFEDYVEDKKDE